MTNLEALCECCGINCKDRRASFMFSFLLFIILATDEFHLLCPWKVGATQSRFNSKFYYLLLDGETGIIQDCNT